MQSEALREEVAAVLREGAQLRLRVAELCADEVVRAARAVEGALRAGGKVLLFGNGGSAADAQHVAAELVGRFARERAPLPAVALTTDTSALTAIANDYGFEHVFARQLLALGRAGDVAIAISTSGRSKNVLVAVEAARSRGLTVIALTGGDGGELAQLADICINVPSGDTARVQECHLAVEHIVCDMVERLMFDDSGSEEGTGEAV